MSKGIFLFVVLFSLFLGVGCFGVIKAAETANVTATVTAQNIAITLLTDGSVAFGTIGVGTTKPTTTAGINDSENVLNNGNQAIDLNITVGDSAGWTAENTPGANQYTIMHCITNCDASPTWSLAGIDSSYTLLSNSVGIGTSQPFDLNFRAPTSSGVYTQQSITITLQAVLDS